MTPARPRRSSWPTATPDGPTEGPWWKSATIYQIWPRSFADGDGDGIGDLAGIRDHLDHLVALGVDAVWLSPVYPSPQDDAGYDISDYRGIDPLFGTLDDFDDLVDALHQRGLKILMDLVVNHTSDRHEWFADARTSVDADRRDWYWWRPPRPGMNGGDPGAEPNNWASLFGGPAWTWHEETGEYYLHLFSVSQPDLNWENPTVRNKVYEMMRWWLDRGINGFRMDVINFISKDVELPDGAIAPGQRFGNGMAHFVDGPRIHEFLEEMRRAVTGDRDELIWVGEMPGVTIDEAVRYTDPTRGEVDMVFQFEHVGVDHGDGGRFDVRPLRLTDLKATLGRWQAGLAEMGWNSLYWNNHDQPRVVSRFGDDGECRLRSSKLLATVLHMHRGTPFVYQGEELGMANYPFVSLSQFRDIESLNFIADSREAGRHDDDILASLNAGARDHARTPMQWQAGPTGGFTSGDPWMPINPDVVDVNAAAQVDDENSVFAHYRRLIELRHELDVVVNGDFEMLLADHEQIYAFTRRLGSDRTDVDDTGFDDELLVLANFAGESTRFSLPVATHWIDADLLIANSADPPRVVEQMELGPWEAVVYRITRNQR